MTINLYPAGSINNLRVEDKRKTISNPILFQRFQQNVTSQVNFIKGKTFDEKRMNNHDVSLFPFTILTSKI